MSMNSFHARQGQPKPAAARPPAAAPLSLRADMQLLRAGLAASRSEAQSLIQAGRVLTEGRVVTKASQRIPDAGTLCLAASDAPDYVSRGGHKLAGALAVSGVPVRQKCCLDVGQSTGGFSDCLLQAGAASVVGVDVGHGQLHPRLAADPRLRAFEGINCRTLSAADLSDSVPPEGFELIVADLSFISLTLVLPCLPALLAPTGDMLLLVKPQFEVGRAGLGKGGIVRNPALYAEVEKKLRACADALHLSVRGWFNSPIAGSDGNREFFIWISHAH